MFKQIFHTWSNSLFRYVDNVMNEISFSESAEVEADVVVICSYWICPEIQWISMVWICKCNTCGSPHILCNICNILHFCITSQWKLYSAGLFQPSGQLYAHLFQPVFFSSWFVLFRLAFHTLCWVSLFCCCNFLILLSALGIN